jgi:hypothetical protein
VKLVKTIQPKLYKEAALVLNLVQNVPDSRTYLDDVRYGLANYYANSAKDVKADAVALKSRCCI